MSHFLSSTLSCLLTSTSMLYFCVIFYIWHYFCRQVLPLYIQEHCKVIMLAVQVTFKIVGILHHLANFFDLCARLTTPFVNESSPIHTCKLYRIRRLMLFCLRLTIHTTLRLSILYEFLSKFIGVSNHLENYYDLCAVDNAISSKSSSHLSTKDLRLIFH